MSFLLIFLVLLVVGLLLFAIEPKAFLPVLERLTPNLRYRVRTTRPLVALSFDDGPHPVFTPQVLQILEQHNAKATFFLIADRALRHPDLVALIRAAGHRVGNHYIRDGSLLHHSDARFVESLKQTETALGITTTPKLFRPPGGVARPSQLRLARAQGYECVLGSAYPHDPLHPPVWYIRWLVVKNLSPGAIVILHDGIANPTRSIQALPHILRAGQTKGLRFVSISNLVAAAEPSDTD
jgi:peptidoglycan/xylan/chitin deacetylase (PgdA/CDA1 family)